MDGILAIDGGQSGSRWRLDGREGDDVPLRTDIPLWPQLADIVSRAPRARGVAMGLTGYVAGNERVDDLARTLDVPTWLAHDSVTSHLGALGEAHGASVAAGTGAVTLGTSPTGAHKVDGNGWIVGDEGSGFWIGAHAVREALRQADGRASATGLMALVEERFGELEGLYVRLQADEHRVSAVAGFARSVLESDDPAARRIGVAAGEALADSVLAALAGSGWPSPVGAEVRLLGGVLASPVVRAALTTRLTAEGVAESSIQRAEGGSLAGAAMLSSLPSTHPLVDRVEHAQP